MLGTFDYHGEENNSRHIAEIWLPWHNGMKWQICFPCAYESGLLLKYRNTSLIGLSNVPRNWDNNFFFDKSPSSFVIINFTKSILVMHSSFNRVWTASSSKKHCRIQVNVSIEKQAIKYKLKQRVEFFYEIQVERFVFTDSPGQNWVKTQPFSSSLRSIMFSTRSSVTFAFGNSPGTWPRVFQLPSYWAGLRVSMKDSEPGSQVNWYDSPRVSSCRFIPIVLIRPFANSFDQSGAGLSDQVLEILPVYLVVRY